MGWSSEVGFVSVADAASPAAGDGGCKTGVIEGAATRPFVLACWLMVCSAEQPQSSAMSFARRVRSEARFESAFRQMRSSSLGIVVVLAGRAWSKLVICSKSSACESARKGVGPPTIRRRPRPG